MKCSVIALLFKALWITLHKSQSALIFLIKVCPEEKKLKRQQARELLPLFGPSNRFNVSE
jgi:hypothetical protein